jgi:hypothetical protein
MFRVAVGLLAVIALAIGVGFAMFYVSSTGRFEVAVTVELDGERYSGSTVWEMSIAAMPELLPAPAVPQIYVAGEAIDIALPDGRTLFILKRDHLSPPNEAFGRLYLVCLPGKDIREDARLLPSFRGSCDIDLKPKVAIRDASGNLEELPYEDRGSLFVSVTATGTAMAVSRGILGRHPWITSLPSEDGPKPASIPFFREDFSRR